MCIGLGFCCSRNDVGITMACTGEAGSILEDGLAAYKSYYNLVARIADM